jgi:hypothetical protein
MDEDHVFFIDYCWLTLLDRLMIFSKSRQIWCEETILELSKESFVAKNGFLEFVGTLAIGWVKFLVVDFYVLV